jgi:hypothetical protein
MKLCAKVERAALLGVLMVLCCGCAASVVHAQDMQPMDAKPADERPEENQPADAPMDAMDPMAPAAPAKRDASKPDGMSGGGGGSPGAAAENDPLAGPRVDDPGSRTLVRYDMQNRLQLVDVRPEEAALGLLDLDETRRMQAREVVLDRSDAVRLYLTEHVELLKEFASPAALKDPTTGKDISGVLAKQLFEGFDPQRTRDPLLSPLATVLTPEEHARLTQLVDEYWEAWIAREQKQQAKTPREKIAEQLVARTFVRETQRIYESSLRPIRQKLDTIANAAAASDEQKDALRRAFVEFIHAGKLRPTAEHRAALAQAIHDALTPEQRVKLVEQMLTGL